MRMTLPIPIPIPNPLPLSLSLPRHVAADVSANEPAKESHMSV